MPEVVYRSTHPDVLAALAGHRRQMDDWEERAAALLAELGLPDRAFLITLGLTGDRRIAGLAPLPEEEASRSAPVGWRYTDWDGVKIVQPDKRRKTGRDANDLLTATWPPDDLRAHLPGMPSHHWDGPTWRRPAVQERSDALWVVWAVEPRSVDPEVWERIPLSQYWAMREAAEGGAA